MLLQDIKSNPLLEKFDAIIIDETHERSLNIDLLLWLLKIIQKWRKAKSIPALKIVLASATIDAEKFSKYFNDAPTQNVEWTMYPIDVHYEEETVDLNDYNRFTWEKWIDKIINKAVDRLWNILTTTNTGDIAIICEWKASISKLIEKAKKLGFDEKIELLPVHAWLKPEEQSKIFKKSNKRKIYFSTNIIETSLTIPWLKYLIDTWLVNQTNYNDITWVTSLNTQYISQDSAEQRKGRVGRMEEWVVYLHSINFYTFIPNNPLI